MANRLTKAKLEKFYAAMGRFAMEWADMEVCLDLVVLALSNPPRSKLPHQLGGKIAWIRRTAAPTLPPELAREAVRLMDEVDSLSDTRHDYIHGGRAGHSFSRSRLVISLARFLQPEKKPRRAPVKVTTDQIEDTADQVHRIGDDLLDLADTILKQKKQRKN